MHREETDSDGSWGDFSLITGHKDRLKKQNLKSLNENNLQGN